MDLMAAVPRNGSERTSAVMFWRSTANNSLILVFTMLERQTGKSDNP